jgi:T5SS/PEP-CTERM-associated repeat protein
MLLSAGAVQASDISWAVAAGDWSVAGNWGGTLPGSGDVAHISNNGTASITLNGAGCGTLLLGDGPGTGTVQMTGGSLSTRGYASVGQSGTGTFAQSGGSANFSGNTSVASLYVGYNAGSSGTYTLSGAAQLSANRDEYVGYAGSGSFVQGGNSVNSITSTSRLLVGYNAGSNGTYTLNDAGSLSMADLYVGSAGTGTFTQNGGTVTIFNQTGYTNVLALGSGTGGNGTYNLGAGQLSAPVQDVGSNSAATASFNQSGGTNAVTYVLFIGSGGRYALNGGALQVGTGLQNLGVFDGGNSPGTLVANCMVDLTTGTWQNLSSTTFTLGTNSLLIVPPGFDPGTMLGAGSSIPFVHTAGTTLSVPAGQGFIGTGTIRDPVNCQGSISNGTDGSLALTGGLTLAGGALNLGSGSSMTINDSTSTMSSGLLSVPTQYVGNGGNGTFTQTGGTNSSLPPGNSGTTGSLYLGYAAADQGTYNLGGAGAISAMGFEYVGYSGTGTFVQTGGTNGLSFMYLGYSATGSGSYVLTAGSCSQWMAYVGYNGSGSLTQSGGTNTISNGNGRLSLGYRPGAVGAYNLNGSGVLNVNGAAYVGDSGTGVFTQTGGTVTIIFPTGWSGDTTDGNLYIGNVAGSSGTFNLSGTGQLTASSTPTGQEYVGNVGSGTFAQSGGTNTVNNLYIGYYSGSVGVYSLSGGSLRISRATSANCLCVGASGSGEFLVGDAAGAGTVSEMGAGTGVGLTVRQNIGASGTVEGWGVVGLSGGLTNNGRVIADGYGQDRTLDFSSFSSVSNGIPNIPADGATTNGWFAQNGGMLVLPPLAVAPGTHTYNWGDSAQISQTDLVNSVQIAISDVITTGPLAGSLLSPDRSDVPPPPPYVRFIGVWNFVAEPYLAFGGETLTFRYDDAMAASLGMNDNLLRVYDLQNGQWIDVTGGLDTVNNLISTDTQTGFSEFAVGETPEPATLSLLALGGLAMLRRRK